MLGKECEDFERLNWRAAKREERLVVHLCPIAMPRSGKCKRKCAAPILDAIYPDPAAVRLNDMLRNREPQTRTQAGAGAIRLEESLKYSVRVFGGDANAGIVNRNSH